MGKMHVKLGLDRNLKVNPKQPEPFYWIIELQQSFYMISGPRRLPI